MAADWLFPDHSHRDHQWARQARQRELQEVRRPLSRTGVIEGLAHRPEPDLHKSKPNKTNAELAMTIWVTVVSTRKEQHLAVSRIVQQEGLGDSGRVLRHVLQISSCQVPCRLQALNPKP